MRVDRSKDPSIENFPIMPSRFKNVPKICLSCDGELKYQSCNIRWILCPEFNDPLKFSQLCTPMGGGCGD